MSPLRDPPCSPAHGPMGRPLVRRETVVAGVRLFYLEREARTAAARPPLLLLHGLVASAETFAELIAGLPDDRRVIALDLLSPVAGGDANESHAGLDASLDASFAGWSERIVAFAAAVRMEQPVLLGHSHGGALALRIAASHPGLVNSLILLCPAHPFAGYDERVVRFYLTGWGRSLARATPWLPQPLVRYGVSRMMGPRSRLSDAALDRYRRVLRSRQTVPRLLRLLESWQRDMGDLREAMLRGPLATPTLLLWGDHDPVVLVGSAEGLEQHLATTERFLLRGMGHLLADEAPADCARLIRTWLIWRETHPRYTLKNNR